MAPTSHTHAFSIQGFRREKKHDKEDSELKHSRKTRTATQSLRHQIWSGLHCSNSNPGTRETCQDCPCVCCDPLHQVYAFAAVALVATLKESRRLTAELASLSQCREAKRTKLFSAPRRTRTRESEATRVVREGLPHSLSDNRVVRRRTMMNKFGHVSHHRQAVCRSRHRSHGDRRSHES